MLDVLDQFDVVCLDDLEVVLGEEDWQEGWQEDWQEDWQGF